MVHLQWHTPNEWADAALSDFDAFLLDHANCERKASAVGLSFVVRYPDRKALIEPMIHFAREELEHFHQVYRWIASRGLELIPDTEDTYVKQLMVAVRFGREERFLDRLLVSSLIEARGSERLELVADALTNDELKAFYQRLSRAEKIHRDLFCDMAFNFFQDTTVRHRLQELTAIEAMAIQSVPFGPTLH